VLAAQRPHGAQRTHRIAHVVDGLEGTHQFEAAGKVGSAASLFSKMTYVGPALRHPWPREGQRHGRWPSLPQPFMAAPWLPNRDIRGETAMDARWGSSPSPRQQAGRSGRQAAARGSPWAASPRQAWWKSLPNSDHGDDLCRDLARAIPSNGPGVDLDSPESSWPSSPDAECSSRDRRRIRCRPHRLLERLRRGPLRWHVLPQGFRPPGTPVASEDWFPVSARSARRRPSGGRNRGSCGPRPGGCTRARRTRACRLCRAPAPGALSRCEPAGRESRRSPGSWRARRIPRPRRSPLPAIQGVAGTAERAVSWRRHGSGPCSHRPPTAPISAAVATRVGCCRSTTRRPGRSSLASATT